MTSITVAGRSPLRRELSPAGMGAQRGTVTVADPESASPENDPPCRGESQFPGCWGRQVLPALVTNQNLEAWKHLARLRVASRVSRSCWFRTDAVKLDDDTAIRCPRSNGQYRPFICFSNERLGPSQIRNGIGVCEFPSCP